MEIPLLGASWSVPTETRADRHDAANIRF